MRDPNRIYKYCHGLVDIWSKVPDWRFGQFMVNMVTILQYRGKDVFNLEDEELFKIMKEFFENDENT